MKDFFSSLPTGVRGAAWMFLSAMCFTSVVLIVRHVTSEGFHPLMVLFLRSLFGVVFLLPWVYRAGLSAVKTRRPGLLVIRSVFAVAGTGMWFLAVAGMNLNDVTALSFSAPLFTTVGVALILGETVGPRRWMAIMAGFLGVLVVLRPGFQELGLPALFAIGSAISFAASLVCVKALSRTESTGAIVLYLGLFNTPMAFVLALFFWQDLPWEFIGWGFAVSAGATMGHLCITKAFSTADASAVMPWDFLRLIMVGVFGYLIFGEELKELTWLGAVIILAAVVYVTHREAQLERRARRKEKEDSLRLDKTPLE